MPRHEWKTLTELRDVLAAHLLESVIPFWMRHAIDPTGGLNTCLRDDGTLVSRDKWLWSQWRAVWMFSALYNRVGQRTQWLDVARQICDFAQRHGWDDRVGGWVLRVSGDGEVLDGCDSIYVDAFAIYGLTQLAIATGEDAPADLARRTADSVLRRLKQPHDQIPHFPYPVPAGARVHGLPMIFSLVLWELGELLYEQRYRNAALAMQRDIFDHFYRAERDVILERIAGDNGEYPAPQGTTVIPGHVIEGMWFQIHIARARGDAARIGEATRLIRRHCELGWDDEHGGLVHAIDADGGEVAWPVPDAKIWWPHTEALYALLLAHEQCGEDWCLDWYRKVHDYAFGVYPVAEHGEWRQKLDRHGRPLPIDSVALPVKDPFHLPRALIYCLEVLDRLCGQRPSDASNCCPAKTTRRNS